jgi:hypothetical protein
LPIVEYEALLEDVEDLASVAERQEEPTILMKHWSLS